MSESTILTIYIMANNLASPIFHQLGMDIMGANGMMGMATAAAVGLGAGIAAIGGVSIKMASTFQQQMARIKGLTGASADEVNYYQQQILALSPAWDLSATDAAKALYFIISAGFKGAQAIDILNYSAKSATASLADQATVADALTSMMNAYKDANISASEAANDLTKIEKYGKAQLNSFASSIGFTMVTAHAAGISIAEASAAIATLSQISGNHGIRRMSMEFDNLARSMLDINAIAKRAKAQGLNFDAAKFATLDFIGKLQYLQQITGALSSNINDETYKYMLATDATKNQAAATAALDLKLDKANSAFMKLTGGAAAFIPAAVLVSGKASEFNYILGQMHDQTDMVTNAFNTMRGTVTQQLKMLEIRFQNIGIAIGLYLLPYVSLFLKALLATLEPITRFVGSASGIDTLKYAMLGLAVIIGGPLVAAVWSLIAPLLPFLATMAAIIAAGIWLGNVFKQHPEILKQLQRLWGDLSVKLREGANWFQQHQTLINGVKTALQRLGDVVAGVLVGIGKFFDFVITHQWALDLLKTAVILLAADLGIQLVIAAGLAAVALWNAAAAALALDWPLALVVLAIAALTYGIIELVSHWSQVQQFFNGLGKVVSDAGRMLHDVITGNWADLPAAYQQMSDDIQGRTRVHYTQEEQLADQHHLAMLQKDATYHQQTIAKLEQQRAKLVAEYKNAQTEAQKHKISVQINYVSHEIKQQEADVVKDKTQAKQLSQHIATMKAHNGKASKGWTDALGSALSGAAHGVGKWFAGVGLAIWQAITTSVQGVLGQFGQIGSTIGSGVLNGMHWLYDHNYYVQHMVDTFTRVKAAATSKISALFSTLKTFITTLVAKLWTPIATKAQETWNSIIAAIAGLKKKIGGAVHDHITQPIQDKWNAMITFFSTAGEQLMKMIAKGITDNAGKIADAAKSALKGLAGWLGFHSPAPKVPESAYWGSNLIKMIAADLTQAGPLLTQAAQSVMQGVSGQFTQPLSPSFVGAAGSLATQTPLVGGGTSQTTINIAFPGIKDGAEAEHTVTRIIEKHGRAINTRNRRGGFGGGFNTGAF